MGDAQGGGLMGEAQGGGEIAGVGRVIGGREGRAKGGDGVGKA